MKEYFKSLDNKLMWSFIVIAALIIGCTIILGAEIDKIETLLKAKP